jgi:hypothetical protein
VLREGLDNGSPVLDLNAIYVELALRMRAMSRPNVQRRIQGNPGPLALAHDAAHHERAEPKPDPEVAKQRTDLAPRNPIPPAPTGPVLRPGPSPARSRPPVRRARGRPRSGGRTAFARFLLAGTFTFCAFGLGPATPELNPLGGAELRFRLTTGRGSDTPFVMFSPDGTMLAALARPDGTVELWRRPYEPAR